METPRGSCHQTGEFINVKITHIADVGEWMPGYVLLSVELQERRKAAEPELKPANLANKFYERYPLATFKSDSERAEAFGYFMAGAELQCFGEFIKYEDLCGDE